MSPTPRRQLQWKGGTLLDQKDHAVGSGVQGVGGEGEQVLEGEPAWDKTEAETVTHQDPVRARQVLEDGGLFRSVACRTVGADDANFATGEGGCRKVTTDGGRQQRQRVCWRDVDDLPQVESTCGYTIGDGDEYLVLRPHPLGGDARCCWCYERCPIEGGYSEFVDLDGQHGGLLGTMFPHMARVRK